MRHKARCYCESMDNGTSFGLKIIVMFCISSGCRKGPVGPGKACIA